MPRIVYQKTGSSKTPDTVSEYLYEISLESGCDEDIGDVQDFGWYGIISFYDDPLIVEEGGETKYVGAIVHEDNYGFFEYYLYENENKLNMEWSNLMEEAAEFYGDEDEEEDEEEEIEED